MSLLQLAAPDLTGVSVGVPSLQYLDALSFSADGNLLLVQATYTDSFDPNGSDLRYAVWIYDVKSGQYTTCLNSLVADSPELARETDVVSASFSGGSGSPQLIVYSAIDDVQGTERLSRVSANAVVSNLFVDVLGADVRPAIQAFAVSSDGRFLAIQTDSTYFSELDTNTTSDIYLIDLGTQKVERVSWLEGSESLKSVALGSVLTNGSTVSVSFTTEGTFARADGNEGQAVLGANLDAYVWSSAYSLNGLSGPPSFQLVSRTQNGAASGSVTPESPVLLTNDGTFYTSSAQVLGSDTNGQMMCFLQRLRAARPASGWQVFPS